MNRFSMVIVTCAVVSCGGSAPPGIVSFGDVIVNGEVDTQSLVAQMNQLVPRFEACYSRAKRQDHSVQGDIQLHITGLASALTPAIQTNTTGSESLAECVSGAVAGLTIEEPGGGTPWDFEADWTLTFSLAGQQR